VRWVPTGKFAAMPNYTFELRDGSGGIDDETGVALADGVHALHYAQDVVHELMRSREAQTRTWRLDVYDEAGERVIELPFATIDPTLDHLRPELRGHGGKILRSPPVRRRNDLHSSRHRARVAGAGGALARPLICRGAFRRKNYTGSIIWTRSCPNLGSLT